MKFALALRQVITLAGLTTLEVVRQPITLVLTLVCAVAIVLNPLLIIHPFGEAGKLARDGALAFHFVFGLFVAAFAASSALTKEVHSGTAAAVLSKPVSRDAFFLGKFVGVAAVTLIFSGCITMATQLNQIVVHHFRHVPALVLLPATPLLGLVVAAILNITRRRHFLSSAYACMFGSLALVLALMGAILDHGFEWRLIPANILISVALIVLAAIAVALSTRMPVIPATVVCATFFLAGLLSDYLFGRASDESLVAGMFYFVIPNWQHFWVTDGLTGGGVIPWSYVANAAGYAVLYIVAVLSLGLVSFRGIDLR